jgi:hypothetical protein
MDERDAIAKDLERQIGEAHARFVAAMAARVPRMSLEQRERYFAALSSLVAKLEDGERPLREILQEVLFEIGPMLLAEMAGEP